MALDEVEAVVAEALGDRRAAGERQHDAAEHQRDERRRAGTCRPSTTSRRTRLRSARLTIRRPPHWLVTPSSCKHERAEGVAALLEILELVEGGAGRRQQHDRLRRRIARGIGAAAATAAASVPDISMRHGRAERRGEILRRLADQIGLGDAREEVGEAGDAAFLGPAAGDPVDAVEARQRLGGGVGVGRLGIVDEEHAADAGRPPPCGGRGRGSS